MNAIRVENLSKNFRVKVRKEGFASSLRNLVKPAWKRVDAVRSVSFEVDEGEILAFLGPNGAGKSTTIKMLTGILHPSSGSSSVLGFDPARQATKLAMHIGTVFGQKSQLWYHLPPSDSFRLLGAVYEIEPRVLTARRNELVERFGIGGYIGRPVRKLSLGERIRCEIVASLLHRPRVLFLDEPTIGLDVIAKQEIRLLLGQTARDEGTTVFMTSHDLGDIEKICKRAIIIHHGAVVVDSSMKELRHLALAKKYVGVRWADPVRFDLPGLWPVKVREESGGWIAASYEVDTRAHRIEEVIRALAGKGELVDITVEDEPFEDIIAEIFAGKDEEAARAVAATRGRST